ncbi:MAG: tyrosine-type recombinase/integrase [Oscillospiraceae bacterium]|jgi:integrase|nr:tyrosine-type recombinase/integrase [Oscillospiraceae bacterium]
MATTQPIRSKKKVRELAGYYLRLKEPRNYALIVLGVYTALRVSDLLRLSWSDVYDFKNRRVLGSFTISEKKTGKRKTVSLNRAAIAAVCALLSPRAVPGAPLFRSRKTGRAISRVQAYRIIRAAADALEMERVSCHSLRKTFGYHAWKSGVSPAVIMEIYNHASFAVTRRYLGVTRDDTDRVYLGLSLM